MQNLCRCEYIRDDDDDNDDDDDDVICFLQAWKNRSLFAVACRRRSQMKKKQEKEISMQIIRKYLTKLASEVLSSI